MQLHSHTNGNTNDNTNGSRPHAILVTGGTGYIGSHTVVELINAGKEVVIIDNLVNSSMESLKRIEQITGVLPKFHECDITDFTALNDIFRQHNFESVIHFAALKAVGESSEIPLEYYRVNVGGTITLLRAMAQNDVKRIVFSSSATVYGDASKHKDMIPIPEECPIGPTNPYGRTKSIIESIITDHCNALPDWSAALLRYFNPAGAHSSGVLGEDPLGVPNNLLPYAAQVAVGRRPILSVFGDDYDSHDGTPIRDYIHVVDLAVAHLRACEKLASGHKGCKAWNIGTGEGSTVLDVVRAFNKSIGREIPYKVVARRAGDVLNLTAKCDLAERELGFKTKFTLQDACDDTWRFIQANPKGMNPTAHTNTPGMDMKAWLSEPVRRASEVGEEDSRCRSCGKSTHGSSN